MFETQTTFSEEITMIDSLPRVGHKHHHHRNLRKSQGQYRTPHSKVNRKKHKSKLLGRFTDASNRDLGVMGGLVVLMYLVNGQEAPLVCNSTTSIAGAILTGLMVKHPNKNEKATKMILGFWILFAILLPFDYFIGHTFGYYAVKFIVIMAAAGLVYRTYKEKSSDSTDHVTNSTILSESPIEEQFTETTGETMFNGQSSPIKSDECNKEHFDTLCVLPECTQQCAGVEAPTTKLSIQSEHVSMELTVEPFTYDQPKKFVPKAMPQIIRSTAMKVKRMPVVHKCPEIVRATAMKIPKCRQEKKLKFSGRKAEKCCEELCHECGMAVY